MESTCATRAVKVLKYLRREVPATIPRSSVDELEELPSGVLARLHTMSNWDEVTKDEQLRSWLAANPVPAPRAKASGPLFNGTLVFVQLTFQVAGQPPSAITMADMQTARDYAALALIPIQRYVSQYGTASVGVSPDVIPFTANLATGSFTLGEFETWVDQIAQTARAKEAPSASTTGWTSGISLPAGMVAGRTASTPCPRRRAPGRRGRTSSW